MQFINSIVPSSSPTLWWYHRAGCGVLTLLHPQCCFSYSKHTKMLWCCQYLRLQSLFTRELSWNRFFVYLLPLTLEFSSTLYLLSRCGHTFSLKKSPLTTHLVSCFNALGDGFRSYVLQFPLCTTLSHFVNQLVTRDWVMFICVVSSLAYQTSMKSEIKLDVQRSSFLHRSL